ncbi:hypothetical protein VT84_30045 [Gemmata sp. SH-PL17]|nr:hypothetical protein VT84_30045 [Gemmata sp. SH-PL17]
MVSAVEGQLASEKNGRHPHTNMAKARLNMMVRMSAPEFAADRVFLTAVDPTLCHAEQRLLKRGLRRPRAVCH